MAIRLIETWLAGRLGLNPDSMVPGAVDAAIRRGMQDHGCDDVAYARILADNEEAWQALVDRVTVHETWFFRDLEPFQFLARWVLERGHLSHPIRILSCPCATGEEPYSIAMTLLDHGFSLRQFTIDAGDVSAGALRSAAAGEFGLRSLRAMDVATRQRHLSKIGEGRYRPGAAVVERVRFRRMNLLESNALDSTSRYDVVFCRNLLIYLHEAARDTVIRQLGRVLDDAGLVVVGHAEAGLMRPFGFRPIGRAAAFAFRRVHQTETPAVLP